MKQFVLITVIMIGAVLQVQSQIKVFPIVSENPNISKKQGSSNTKTSSTPLSLPFWDDFSKNNTLDTLLWQNSDNVWINNGLTFLPPSSNVASFDGVDAEGQPYGGGSSSGLVDSLSSRPIDLNGYSFADNIYMSFYYQAGGLGNNPNDQDDSLRLEFLNDTGTWETVWPTNGISYDGEYEQVILPISENRFLHENFRFRFQSVGNLTGMFDIWNVDYIYINKNRSMLDLSYPDRTINEPLSSFLQNYFSIPYTHYLASQNGQSTFWIRNLVTGPFTQNKAYKYFFNYEIDVADTTGFITSFNGSTFVEPLESPIGIGDTELVTIREPIDDFSSIEAADSARILFEIILDAEDNKPISEAGDYDPSKYAPIDFRANDTLRSEFFLTDYYAYDDGTAESSAGLNFAADFLAVQFELLTDSARITAVDMYFPFIGSEPAGKSIDLIIWSEELGFPGEILHRQQVIVQRLNGLNNFVRYDLSKSVQVKGTYFVGYRQNTNGDLGLGLDMNTFSADRMFFNLDELWEQNVLVPGSLMIRPVFGVINDDTVVGNENPIQDDLAIWPNPSSNGIYNLRGRVLSYRISDLNGRIITEGNLPGGSDAHTLDLSSRAPGVYVITLQMYDGSIRSLKLVRDF